MGYDSRLTFIKDVEERRHRSKMALYRCTCGNEKIIVKSKVRRGTTLSCGCLVDELRSKRTKTHGLTKTPVYKIWNSMKQRCLNKTHAAYSDYGGRGITVCLGWKVSFETFATDMGVRPVGTSLDRIDNEKGYSRGNCRWASKEQQVNNTRSNVFLEWEGIRLTMGQWANVLEVPRSRIWKRIHLSGWSVERALFTQKSDNQDKIGNEEEKYIANNYRRGRGGNTKELAEKFGIAESTVRRISKRARV